MLGCIPDGTELCRLKLVLWNFSPLKSDPFLFGGIPWEVMAAKVESDIVPEVGRVNWKSTFEKQEDTAERGLCLKRMQLQVELRRGCEMLMSKFMPVAEEVIAALQSVSEQTCISTQNLRGGRTLQWLIFPGRSQGSAKANILRVMRSGMHPPSCLGERGS